MQLSRLDHRLILESPELSMGKIILPLIIRKSRWWSVVSLVGTLIALGIIFRILLDRNSTWALWVIIIFFGFFSGFIVVWLGQLWSPEPRLTISEEGIFAAHWNVGLISWNDIGGVFVKTDGGDEYVCLTLRDPESFRDRMGKLARIFNTATRQTGFSDFTVKPADFGFTTNMLLELVRLQIELAKTRPKPTAPSFKYYSR
jgi:hypothetical protein